MFAPQYSRFCGFSLDITQKAVAFLADLIYDMESYQKEAMELSNPKLVSPMLDGFIMDQPMSDHHGVRCCPAIQVDTDERYIVKVISIPASQAQLDALLLTGAYTNEQQAQEYFNELAQDVTGEIEVLRRLSKLEGFLPYQDVQVEAMDTGVGHDIYLLSPYRRSLRKQMIKHPLTHLDAVNLGLDMCAALAISRRAGYLYVDLRPSNIFVTDTQGYRIGDLGFLSLSSLPYASLPERYRSDYTAPEITDAMSALNDTLDVYALGLVLYQVYNNGQLPFDEVAPGSMLPAPMYADYEMGEIILKACAPDPKERWADPAQMGQALVNYMQRNEVNDTPIIPPPPEPTPEEQVEGTPAPTEEENDADLAELLALIPDEDPPVQEVPPEAPPQVEELVSDDSAVDVEPEPAEVPLEETDIPEDAIDTPPEVDADAATEEDETVPCMDADEAPPPGAPADAPEQAEPDDNLTQMLAQADDLISHQPPEPVVVPDPIDIPIPPPIILEKPNTSEKEDKEDSVNNLLATVFPDACSDMAVAEDEAETNLNQEDHKTEICTTAPSHQSIPKRWIGLGVTSVIVTLLTLLCLHYYHGYYLQTIDGFRVIGAEDQISVWIRSDIDESLLTVVCTDTYGNTKTSPVTGGSAVFRDLDSNTQYRIHVKISGYHKLRGPTTSSYTTAAQTKVLDFTAMTGPEDGSVVLRFTVDGPEPTYWCLEYSTKDTPPRTIPLDGHTATVNGLTIGANYTFRLIPSSDLHLTGNYQLNYTVQKPIYAVNPTITACGNGSLTVVWTAPADASDSIWRVRCYNRSGYNQTIFATKETTATFTELDHTTGYTVTITAVGMAQSVSTTVTANSINVTNFHTEIIAPWAMTLTWDFTGTAPKSGWLLRCTIDGSAPLVVNCETNQAVVALTPGCTYSFDVQPADDVSCFTVPFSYGPVTVDPFKGYGVTAANMRFSLYLGSIQQDTFAAGDKALLKGLMDTTYGRSEETIVTTFVIRNDDGTLHSADTYSCTWEKLWKARASTLKIPKLPTQAGGYHLDLYFNDMYVTTLSFTIT